MVVAVIAVRMVQVAVDEIVDMVPVGDGLVPAPGAMYVFGRVRPARMTRSAPVRVRRVDVDRMVVEVVAVSVEQAAVLQIVRVPLMFDGGMAARWAVVMIVVVVPVADVHVVDDLQVATVRHAARPTQWQTAQPATE